MTYTAVPVSAVTAAIKTLLGTAVPTLTVLDTLEIPTDILTRDCPVLFPDPRDGFVSGFEVGPADTMGAEGQRLYTIYYRLRYTLAYAPVGSERDLGDVVPGCADMVKMIIYASMANDLLGGAVIEFRTESVSGNGLVADPAGNLFYGFTFLFLCTEYAG